VPLIWLLSVAMTAGVKKIFHPDPRIGFLAQAETIQARIDELHERQRLTVRPEDVAENTRKIELLLAELPKNKTLLFNNYLDAFVAGVFLVLVALIFLVSIREWILLLARKKLAALRESEPVWLPDYAVAEGKPLRLFSLLTLAFALAKELSG